MNDQGVWQERSGDMEDRDFKIGPAHNGQTSNGQDIFETNANKCILFYSVFWSNMKVIYNWNRMENINKLFTVCYYII